MKRLILTIFSLGLIFAAASAASFKNETLHYKVMYKWGLINKQAGTVTISLKNNGNHYNGLLTAKSDPWADKMYRVRDTLKVDILKASLMPVVYEKISHEGGDDKYDKVVFTKKGATVYGDCTRLAKKNGQITKDEKRSLEAIGTTVDMFTAFYYMRTLPYESWDNGHVLSINIFSGKQKELLTIKYHGTQKVDYDGKTFDCYKITFIFTSDGKKKSSDDMYAWIDKDTLVPVKLEGKLPIGSVKCFLTD